jgi:hypothetical protein
MKNNNKLKQFSFLTEGVRFQARESLSKPKFLRPDFMEP